MKTAPFLTAVAGFLFVSTGPPVQLIASPAPASATLPDTRAKIADPIEGVDRAKVAVIGFLQAKSVDKMAKFVRCPERVLPKMKAYYAQKAPAPLPAVSFADVKVIERSGTKLVETQVKAGTDTQLILHAEVPAKGPAAVDWESFTGWCEIPWTGFVKAGSEKPRQFRVQLSPTDYYNFSFADSKRYACFRIADKTGEETLYGYCERSSKVYKELLSALTDSRRSDGKAARHSVCTLKLSMKPADAPHHQAAIEEFLWQSWVEP
jgi:hypothetical protein